VIYANKSLQCPRSLDSLLDARNEIHTPLTHCSQSTYTFYHLWYVIRRQKHVPWLAGIKRLWGLLWIAAWPKASEAESSKCLECQDTTACHQSYSVDKELQRNHRARAYRKASAELGSEFLLATCNDLHCRVLLLLELLCSVRIYHNRAEGC
jgi:hypothetical protein